MSSRKPDSKQNGPNPQEINTLAAMFAQKRYLEAENLSRVLTKRFPRNGACWASLGAVLKQRGNNIDALAAMRKSEKLTPNAPDVHYSLGLILSEMGQLAEAEASYGRAIQIKPDYAQAHHNLGSTLKKMGRVDEAEASYRRALQINPADALAHNNLGLVLHDTGRLEEAEACYRQALQIKPDYVYALFNLGNTLGRLDQPEKADACYQRVLELKPDFADAHYQLGILLLKHRLCEEAVTRFNLALSLSPNASGPKINLCQAIYLLSTLNPEKAQELAYKARQMYPDDPIVLRGTEGVIGQTQTAIDETIYTRELFNDFARTFESTLKKLDYSIPERLADELGLASHATGNSLDVLDAGCGTGLCATYLRPVARTLVGVDLSPEMLRVAKEKNLYDALHEGRINDFMKQNVSAFDLIVLADVLVYFGDLQDLVESSSHSLRQGGIVAISLECIEREESGDTYVLQPSGRYRHSTEYVNRLFRNAGFSIEKSTPSALRTEGNSPLKGWIVIAKKLHS